MSNSFWETTYRQNIAKMIGVCCRYTQNRQIAEDLAHDAFLVAIDKISSFENRGPFEAWLRRIAVNVALQYLREQKRQGKWAEAHAYCAIANDIPEENQGNNDHSFSETELLEVIGNLPEHHRLVFNLYVVDNFTHTQIASCLGISEGTSKSHLARARKKIRELLSDKLRNDGVRKRTLSWLMLSYRIRNVDSLLAEKLNNLAIWPKKMLLLNISSPEQPVLNFKHFGISYATYLKTGVIAIATTVFLTGSPKISDHENSNDIAPVKFLTSHLTQDKFSHPLPATISENPVIVKKTKNSETMKNLNTLAGIMVASLALDTAGFPTKLPNAFQNHQIMVGLITKTVTKPESAGPAVPDRHSDLPAGSFYASKLYWSAGDN